MKKKFFLFIAALLFSGNVIGSENIRLPNIRSMALGGNGVMFSTEYNPAILSYQNSKILDISYINRYMVKELGTVSLGFQYPNDKLSTGLYISSFGYDEYRETMFRAAFAKSLGEHWSLGIAFQYYILQSALYEHTPSRLSTDIGAVYSPVEKLSIGLLIKDFPSVSVNKESTDNEILKYWDFLLGFKYDVINNTLISFYCGTDSEYRLTGGIGMEYLVKDIFHIRGGLCIAPLLPSFGFGIRLKSFCIDTSVIYHSVLGASLGAGLSFHF